MTTRNYNDDVIDEFRANAGQVGGRWENTPLLLLHTFGAKTGAERVHPMTYSIDGDRWVVFASKAGAPVHPAWYHNLVENPEVIIEVGAETIPVSAATAGPAERERLYTAQVAKAPVFGDYQVKAGGRIIPVVILTRR